MHLGTVLNQYLGHHGAAVGLIQFLEKLLGYSLILHIPAQQLKHTVQRQHALRHQVHTVHISNGRNLRVHIIQGYIQLFPQYPGHNGGAGAAAHNGLGIGIRHEVVDHPHIVLRVAGRTGHQMHRLAVNDAHTGHRCIVPRPELV